MCRCSRQLFALAYRMAKMVHPRRTDGEYFSHSEHFQGHPYEYFACSRLYISGSATNPRLGRLAPELDLWRDDAVEWGSALRESLADCCRKAGGDDSLVAGLRSSSSRTGRRVS